MTEREKITAAVTHLKEQRVAENTAAPLLWRLYWQAGLLIPPPYFLGFFPVLVFTGLPFGIGMNVMVVAFLLVFEKSLAWPVAAAGASGAVLFGGLLASYYRWSAQRLGLPPWSEFRPDFDTPEDSW